MPPLSNQDLELRRTCLTGSEVGAALRLSRWRTPQGVCAEKWGLPIPRRTGLPLDFGHWAEDVTCSLFAAHHPELDLVEVPSLRDPVRPWMGGSPDRVVVDRSTGARIGVLEAKWRSWDMVDRYAGEGTAWVSPEILAQVAWYMALLDVPRAWTAILWGGWHQDDERDLLKRLLLEQARPEAERNWARAVSPGNLLICEMERDPVVEAKLIAQAETFWVENVLGHQMPEVTTAQEAAAVDEAYQQLVKPIRIEAGLGDCRATAQYIEADGAYHEARDRREVWAGRIKARMAEAEIMRGHGFTVTWKKSRTGRRLFKVFYDKDSPEWRSFL